MGCNRKTNQEFHTFDGAETMKVENQELRTHRAVIVDFGPWREEFDEALAPLI